MLSRYLVTGGLVDRIARHSHALIETDFFLDQDRESPVLLASYDLLARIVSHLKRNVNENGSNSVCNGDATSVVNEQTTTAESHLLHSLETTEAAGAVGALYATFALTSHNQKSTSPTPNQSASSLFTKTLALTILRLLRTIGELDLRTLQVKHTPLTLFCFSVLQFSFSFFLYDPIGIPNSISMFL